MRKQGYVGETVSNDVNIGPAPDTVLPWSKEGLRKAQHDDTDIGFIIERLEGNKEKPTWDSVTLKSHDVKTLWGAWERLAIRDGILKRRFEAPDGLSERCQVVWPKALRQEFLQIAHGGMTGGISVVNARPS